VECILAPHRSLRTALITRMARPQWSVGFRKSSASWLYHHRVPYPAVHEAERNLSLIDGMAEIPVRAVQPVLAIPDDILDRSHHMLKLIQDEETLPVIALAPGSVWATKRYSLRHIQHIAHELLNRHHVVLVGGPDDMGLCQAIEDHVRSDPHHLLLRGRITNLCGTTSLIELIALLQNCSAILTNDSAPTHLANIAGCRVVSVFGPTVPSFGFAPRGAHDYVVERTDLSCRPCSSHGSHRCPLGHHACMEGIAPESILEKLQQQ
jgi:heptosyltransferase II